MRGKCLGLARGMTTFLRVLMSLFTQAGLDNVCQGLGRSPLPDTDRRHTVPHFIAEILGGAVAPFPDPALYAMGTLTNREFCKCSEKLVVLYLAGMAKVNHFSVKALIDDMTDEARLLMLAAANEAAAPVVQQIADLHPERHSDTASDADSPIEALAKALKWFATEALDTMGEQSVLTDAGALVRKYVTATSVEYRRLLQSYKRKAAADDLNRIARSAAYIPEATWTTASAEGFDIDYNYLNCGQGMEDVINTLGTKGMTKQYIEMTITELTQRMYSGRERSGSGAVSAMQFASTRDAQWDSDSAGPKMANPIVAWKYDVHKRSPVLCVATGFVFEMLERLDIHPAAIAALGAPFEQQLPENFSQMSMDISMLDGMRSAVASSLPGGLPRGVFYFDGTIPTTESHGAFPAFAGSTCPTSVHEAAPTADSSPRDAKDLFGSQGAPQGKRHKGAAGSTNVSYHRSVGWSCSTASLA